jgi:Pvc16 N-terminal domain
VIYEVDEALRSLIRREGLVSPDVEVVFDAPTKDWASRRNSPTVDVYLYDIREDMRRRERGQINEYGDGGRVVARRLPPRYFKLSYLVTAWTQRPEDEHRLLSSMLTGLLRHDAIPRDLLAEPMDSGLPVALTIGLPPPEDRAFADVWSALGGELKPSLDVVVTVPTDTGQRHETGPPVVRPPRVTLSGTGGWPPTEQRDGTMPDDVTVDGVTGDGVTVDGVPAGDPAHAGGAPDIAGAATGSGAAEGSPASGGSARARPDAPRGRRRTRIEPS